MLSHQISKTVGTLGLSALLFVGVVGPATFAFATDVSANTEAPAPRLNCASNLRSVPIEAGESMTVDCPRRCTRQPVWGTDVYSADSSVCAAAVHAGLVDPATGGRVLVQASGAEEQFTSSERNGIRSQAWGPWPTSFSLAPAPSADATLSVASSRTVPVQRPRRITCTTQAQDIRGGEGEEFLLHCPQNCSTGSVFGTDDYFEGSAVCRAAIHAGAISESSGGTFILKVGGEKRRFTASDSNGVSSRSWGPWTRSFSIMRVPN